MGLKHITTPGQEMEKGNFLEKTEVRQSGGGGGNKVHLVCLSTSR